MVLRKECAVCHKKYLKGWNDNWVNLYNDAIVRLDQLPQNAERELVPNDLFVCKRCAKTAATVKCGLGRGDHSTQTYVEDYLFSLDMDKIVLEQLKNDVREKETLSEFLSARGLAADAKRVSNHPYWVCDNCYRRFVKKAVEKMEKCSAVDLFTYAPIVHKSGCCSRCRQKIKHDFALIVRKFYECKSWESEDLVLSDTWELVSSTAMNFLKDGHLCHKCVPFLLPENVNLYVQYMCDEGWKRVLPSATSLRSTFKKEVKVGLDDDCNSEEELDESLKNKAISLGANALIGFHCEEHGEDWFTGGATPIRVNSAQRKKGEEAKNIVIDGSNMIRFNDGNHVGGLIAFVREMKKMKATMKVFLDANIIHVLDDAGETKARQCLEGEIKKSKAVYAIVPAGSRADDFILQYADRTGATIVSNDRYLQYVDRYPWVKDGRVAHFMFDDKRLMIPDLGIDIAARGGHD
jgi:uncharacterized protein YlaI/rRNA-processing protein FCF1